MRSIPDKLIGVIYMFLAIFIFFYIWEYETREYYSPSKEGGPMDEFDDPDILLIDTFVDPKFVISHKIKFWFFIATFILLGWIGAMPAEEPFVSLGLDLTFLYFLYFTYFIGYTALFEKFELNIIREQQN